MNRNLLRTPSQAKLRTRKPHTTTLNDGSDLRSLYNHVLHRNTLERSTVQIVELGVPLAVTLRQLDLDVRRVREDIALLVLAVLQSRRVERLNHLLVQIGLEPGLGILDALVNHELIHLLEHLLELLELRAIVNAAEGKIHRVLRAVLRLKRIQTEGRRHRNGGLHHQALAAVVQVRLLRTAGKSSWSGQSDHLGLERGRVDDA